MTESKSGSEVRPSRAARSARIRAGQVANMAATAGSGTQSISALTCGPATRVRAAAISRDGHRQRGHGERGAAAPGLVGGRGGAQQRPDRLGGRGQGHLDARVDRADGALAGQRLPDDARQEARGRGVGTARAHADGHQAHGPPVQETLARVVGQQIFILCCIQRGTETQITIF